MNGPVVIFTPTIHYGSIAEQYECIRNQNTHEDIVWIIADELYEQRKDIVKENTPEVHTVHLQVTKEKGHYRNLARSYNLALQLAREKYKASLFVSLQDYIWIPDNGIRRFIIAANLYPDCLLTGLMSIYKEPGPDKIVDPKGLWTIFGKPWYRKPEGDYWWEDVRRLAIPGGARYVQINPLGWEQNWAAIPAAVLHDDALNYDEDFDIGVAYENCDFGVQAYNLGYKTVIDYKNEAYGFAHKSYWPEKEQADMAYSNTDMFNKKWGIE